MVKYLTVAVPCDVGQLHMASRAQTYSNGVGTPLIGEPFGESHVITHLLFLET